MISMFRIIERCYAYSDEKKNLDERIRDAGVRTYKLARSGAVAYPTYEAYEKEDDKRSEIAKRDHGDDYLYFYKSVETYWYYLGNFQHDLKMIANWLETTVTYKPHREEVRTAYNRLERRVDDYINEMWYNVEEYEEISAEDLEAIKDGDYTVHCEYCIKEFKKFINVACRILRENEVDHFYF